MKSEVVLGVAVKNGNRHLKLPKPYRHGDLMVPYYCIFNHPCPGENQGFYTNKRSFVSRKEALSICRENDVTLKGTVLEELFSENLW